jgi:hypothetical protein
MSRDLQTEIMYIVHRRLPPVPVTPGRCDQSRKAWRQNAIESYEDGAEQVNAKGGVDGPGNGLLTINREFSDPAPVSIGVISIARIDPGRWVAAWLHQLFFRPAAAALDSCLYNLTKLWRDCPV